MRHKLTKGQLRMLREIRAKLDPKKTPKPPTQGDYVEDVPFLLTLVWFAYEVPRG